MSKKTAVIYNTIESLDYFIIDGDLTKYNDVYANMVEPKDFEPKGKFEDLAMELFETYERELDSKNRVTIKEFREAIVNGAELIECGFLP